MPRGRHLLSLLRVGGGDPHFLGERRVLGELLDCEDDFRRGREGSEAGTFLADDWFTADFGESGLVVEVTAGVAWG